MKPLPKFEAGQLVTAADWNAVAREVNRIWAMEAGPGLKLTKGNPWRISTTEAFKVDGTPNFNGPIWEIYVYRETGADDYDITEDPTAIFLTGPFTQSGTTATKHIARLKKGNARTVVDAAFARAGGIIVDPNYYDGTKMAKVPATGAMLFQGQAVDGVDATWLDDTEGFFWGCDATTGELLFSPLADVETQVPGATQEPITGIGSFGDTIAVSFGDLSALAGIMLFDTDGNVIETSPGNYLFTFLNTATNYNLTAYPGIGYLASSNNVGTSPFIHALDASAAAGLSLNPFWAIGAGTGGGPYLDGYWTFSAGAGPSMERRILLICDSWDGVASSDPVSLIKAQGAGPFSGQRTGYGGATLGFNSGLIHSAGPTIGDSISVKVDSGQIVICFDGNTVELTDNFVGADFDGRVYDAKFFSTRQDGTHQIIMVGDFTTFKGEQANYICFVDQDGNRLTDLEWPS